MPTERCARPKVNQELQNWLDCISNRRNRPVLLVVGEIDEQVADSIRLACSGILKDSPKLSVVLHSYGGDPKSAYQMILHMRWYAEDIEILVPWEAKSAATLICLGASKIFMGERGELGPLDMQISEGRGRDFHSALDSFKASEQLLEHALLALNRTAQETSRSNEDRLPLLLRQQNTRRTTIYRQLTNSLMNSIVSNLYQGFDADELGESSKVLSEMEEYAVRALHRGGYTNQNQLKRISHRLVWEYPSHDFPIDLKEAHEMGLNALSMSSEDLDYEEIVSVLLSESDSETIDNLMDVSAGTLFAIGLSQRAISIGEPDQSA